MQAMTLRQIRKATDGKVLRGSSDIVPTGVSTDTRTLKPGDLFIALIGDNHDGHRFITDAVRLGASALIVSRRDAVHGVRGPGIVLVNDTTRALGDLANWYRRQLPTTVIGITGSNGKTTTKDMLYQILSGVVTTLKTQGNFNNAIGMPLTLFRVRPGDVYTILEMGTNSPGEISRLCEIADPDIGVLTNVSETHLEGLGSLEGIAREKSALIRHTALRSGSVYNADNFWTRQVGRPLKGTAISFGAENEADVRMFNLLSDAKGISFKIIGGPRITIPILGSHNAMNALAAIAVARRLGIDWSTIVERLATFQLPDMRMASTMCAGALLINDAYNASPASVEAAARTLQHIECAGRRIFVVGDMLELGSHASEAHRRIGKLFAECRFDLVLGIGTHTAELLDAAVRNGLGKDNAIACESTEDIAGRLKSIVGAGDVVLFKGSRGMHLDQAFHSLEQKLGGADLSPEAQERIRELVAVRSQANDDVPEIIPPARMPARELSTSSGGGVR